MIDNRKNPKIEFEEKALYLDYAFNRGLDLKNRIIRLTEDIEDHSFDWFDTAITALETENRKAITMRISCYGGDVYGALGIIGRMQKSKCKINTEGYGKIMSAATAILAAGSGTRSMSRLADFMHHETSYSVDGKHSDIQHEVKMSQNLSEKWCFLMFELTGVSKQYWATRGVGKDYYLTAEQCLGLNIVDEVF